jgi:two-component system, NarL family, invasion response regulator UvrY
MLKVLIADDHAIIRRGLKQILLEEYPAALIGEANDTPTLINKAISSNWDFILSDLSMPGGGGLEAVHQIRQVNQAVPILILSFYPEEQYAFRVIKAGASGYMNKNAATEELIYAVHRLLAGRKYISNNVAEQLCSEFHQVPEIPKHYLMSEREYRVFLLIAAGKSITDIAGELLIGTTTVSTYRTRILQKMSFSNNAELIKYALEAGLI